MGRLFSMDGKLSNVMGKIADLVLLNILWLLCCIPIVTIGASTTALYYVMLKMVKNEEAYVCSSFFHSFKENFKQSTFIWAITLLIGTILYFDVYFISHVQTGASKIMFVLFLLVGILLLMMTSYVFPILAFFKNSTKGAVKNALLMAVGHLPYTVVIVVAGMLPVLILFAGNLLAALFIDIIIGVSLAAWINAHIFSKLFEWYM